MTKPRTAFLSLALLLGLVPVCSAQLRGGTVEINPFGGYLFGGTFPAGSTALFSSKVDVDDHPTYGGRIGWNITGKFEAEAQFSRTETHFVSHGGNDVVFGPAGTKLGDLTIDYALGYMTFNFGRSRIVPYATFGMGAARLEPDVCKVRPSPCVNPSDDWRYTVSAGAGLKTFVNRHFGFRFDGRYYGTLLRSDNRDRCCRDRTDWLSNGDINGGLIFAF